MLNRFSLPLASSVVSEFMSMAELAISYQLANEQ